MNDLGGYILLFVCIAIIGTGIIKKVAVFDVFLKGAKGGLECAVKILPPITALVTAVSMIRACGIIDFISVNLSWLLGLLKLPAPVLPLCLLGPISGSGSLAVVSDILNRFGPDSYPGRVASVMMGSTETTFYTVAVYYGSVGIKKTGVTLPAALTADITGFILAALAVRIFFGC